VPRLLGTIVDTTALWQTIVYALVAAVGVTLIFSLAIHGAAKYGDHTRDGRMLAATLSGGLAVVGLLATAAAIVVAVIVMTTK
jgi:hypothetical protein